MNAATWRAGVFRSFRMGPARPEIVPVINDRGPKTKFPVTTRRENGSRFDAGQMPPPPDYVGPWPTDYTIAPHPTRTWCSGIGGHAFKIVPSHRWRFFHASIIQPTGAPECYLGGLKLELIEA